MTHYIHPDDESPGLATPADAIREYAQNAGREFPEQAWILHDWDVWVRNPFYSGPPVPHPEDDDAHRERDEVVIDEATGKPVVLTDACFDDDIPF